MLDLSSRGYDSRNIESLIEVLILHLDIENLILYRNNLNGRALETLIPALLKLPKLRKLDLCFNSLTDNCVPKLTPIVEKGLLKCLILSENSGITDNCLSLLNSWRKSGLDVQTYHTSISRQFIINGTEEERVFECSM